MRFPALAAATLLCLTALTACTDADDGGSGGPDASPSEPTSSSSEPTEAPSEPTDEPTNEPTEEPTEPSGGAAVPAYWVGKTPMGTRLYREFQRVDGEPLLAAAELIAGGGQADDPDYRTLWPSVAIESVQPTDGLLLVTLADDGFTTRPDGMSAKSARLAIQQMVHTLQGVQQERVPVQFFRPAGPQQLFGLSTDQPFRQAPPLDVLSLVNVTAPAEGDSVSGDTLQASGVASSFEANVPWEIRQGDQVVLDGFTTADGWMDRLHPWQASIDVSSLEPGDYTFVALTDDPSGGAEGPGAFSDTKDVTLR